MAETFQVRDIFNPKLVAEIATNIQSVWKSFNTESFQGRILAQLQSLSYNDRMYLIRDALYEELPKNYQEAMKIILESFGPELDDAEINGFGGFYYSPFGAYVSKYGQAKEDYNLSMKALYEVTKRFTAEGPIRPFIRKYKEPTFEYLYEWVEDPNVHVRRLVSEGTRPRLPWAEQLPEFIQDPSPILPLLERLKEDPELYVRRSVANSINDIAKDNPKVVTSLMSKWSKSSNEGTQWIIGHGLRSLVKERNLEAMEVLGYKPKAKVELEDFSLSSEKVKMGGKISFDLALRSKENANLMVDFGIHFMKANGKQSLKVFKGTKKKLQNGEVLRLSKSFSFKPLSTRVYYKGKHAYEIFVNGKSIGQREFEVI